MKKKINWKEILMGTWYFIVAMVAVMLHVIQFAFNELAFMPRIYMWLLFLGAGIPFAWWTSRVLHNWLNRIFDNPTGGRLNNPGYIATMFLLLSWLPPALVMTTNYVLAGEPSKVTLPVLEHGTSSGGGRVSKTYNWVRVEKNGYSRKMTLPDSIAPQTVDSVELEVRDGGLGYECYMYPRFIRH
ncbi:hypothetical protein [Chitinophaga qingshengii]|uniref:Ig-like domain-containing protein n=1 Tax=Chitinophaga qingshengii TaxID=1569794 RepID=A0ABR7TKF5_9BACT|nr:hypothetical protein [Chitinophaga qingshengii]MBC9930013.1 hypothetical protein [Chitinophaga qingshengii]